MESNVVLTMRGITMTFPGVKALDHVDLTLRKGEIMALMVGRLPSVNIAYILYIIGWITFLIFMVKNTLNIKADLKNIEEKIRNIGRD